MIVKRHKKTGDKLSPDILHQVLRESRISYIPRNHHIGL